MLVENTGPGNYFRLRAVVVRKTNSDDLVKRASLLQRDSVHGRFSGTIRVDEVNNSLVAGFKKFLPVPPNISLPITIPSSTSQSNFFDPETISTSSNLWVNLNLSLIGLKNTLYGS